MLHCACFLQSLFDHIPVGVGSKGVIPMTAHDFEECLEMGMDWTLREGYSWAEDKEHCEEYGRMLSADPQKVSFRAKKRGLPQVTNRTTVAKKCKTVIGFRTRLCTTLKLITHMGCFCS